MRIIPITIILIIGICMLSAQAFLQSSGDSSQNDSEKNKGSLEISSNSQAKSPDVSTYILEKVEQEKEKQSAVLILGFIMIAMLGAAGIIVLRMKR